MLDEFFTPTVLPDHNYTAMDAATAHDTWELVGGLMGARIEGTHPFRRLFVSLTQ